MAGLRDTFSSILKSIFPQHADKISDAAAVLKKLYGLLPFSPDTIEILKYKDVIEYFVKEKPNDQQIVKGAMMIFKDGETSFFVQMFLNKENKPIGKNAKSLYGRRLIYKTMDAELKDAFGDTDLVIVE